LEAFDQGEAVEALEAEGIQLHQEAYQNHHRLTEGEEAQLV
jgi:hypothetical protein